MWILYKLIKSLASIWTVFFICAIEEGNAEGTVILFMDYTPIHWILGILVVILQHPLLFVILYQGYIILAEI